MKEIRDRRNGVLATVTGISVAVAGVLLFARTGPSSTPDAVPRAVAVAKTASAPAAGARGSGIPPAPGSTQNAPPNPNADAPTANLKRIANALRLNYKSVTAVVTLPAGLNLTARVDVSILFGNQGQRITQTYNDAAGNNFLANFPEGGGQKRREEIIISLAEAIGNGNFTPYAVKSTANIEPLYDVSTSPLKFTLVNDCDSFGASEPLIRWRLPSHERGAANLSMRGGESVELKAFARTYTEVGQSSNLEEPKFSLIERDPEFPGTGFYRDYPSPVVTPLLPGKTRTVNDRFNANNDSICTATIRYSITYQLRQYPNLRP